MFVDTVVVVRDVSNVAGTALFVADDPEVVEDRFLVVVVLIVFVFIIIIAVFLVKVLDNKTTICGRTNTRPQSFVSELSVRLADSIVYQLSSLIYVSQS